MIYQEIILNGHRCNAGENYRWSRGGSGFYGNSEKWFPSAYNALYPTNGYSDVTTRAILIIK